MNTNTGQRILSYNCSKRFSFYYDNQDNGNATVPYGLFSAHLSKLDGDMCKCMCTTRKLFWFYYSAVQHSQSFTGI